MLFNSGVFLQFFAAVLLLYYLFRQNLHVRNGLLLAASYLFYGWWDYRFLSLLFLSSLLDYGVGLGLDRLRQPRSRRRLLALSLTGNLSLLGLFKYYDFFVDSLAELLGGFGVSAHLPTLRIILPVGISFYTFQTMSYAIDVYRGDLKPTRNFLQFLTYVAFFPQLVAGPIERGRHLLPQFAETRRITMPMLEEGIWLCLWGMFKKVVLADNLAPLVDMIYDHPRPGALLVVLGTIAFGFQIYCDFSGYSDIARGTARLLGFDLMWNFHLPYLATSLREFWRRWHISLSTWLRDYLYIGLGGNRRGPARTYANLFLTMLLGGLWHGAAWNFVAWGAWHGCGLAFERIWTGTHQGRVGRSSVVLSPEGNLALGRFTLGQVAAWAATMLFVFYGWLLFRAGSWPNIVTLTRNLTDLSTPSWTASYGLNLAVFTLPLVVMQAWQARTDNLLVPLALPRWARNALHGGLLIAIVVFWRTEKVSFIYFQF